MVVKQLGCARHPHSVIKMTVVLELGSPALWTVAKKSYVPFKSSKKRALEITFVSTNPNPN